jgi:acetoin utilization protein AcuC
LHISVHQDPRTLYPGKGFIDEIGEGEGKGYSVNIPLPPWTSDTAYEYVLRAIFIPLAREFKPELIVMIDGSDTHFTDRITQMGLTLKGIKMIGNIVRETAEEVCEGKVVDFVGSGYSRDSRVVALGWLSSIAGVTGIKLELEEPVPIPNELNKDLRLKETEGIIEFAKGSLCKYWKCFVT